MGETDFESIRETEFPAAAGAVHLKASGGSPMCRSAYEAGEAYLEEMCFEGDLHYERYLERLQEARSFVAAYLGAAPDEVGFSVNSSSSASIAAAMLERCGVGRVYFPIGEFPTSVHALKNLGLDGRAVGDPSLGDGYREWLRAIDADLSAGPALRSAVVISHVSFLSGARANLAEVASFCRSRSLTLVVNATQSFGALPIDVGESVDMLFATGLKWMCAGYGAGFLYLRQALVEEVGLPHHTGWLSVENPYRMDNANVAVTPRARSLDAGGGMPHFGPLLSLWGALKLYSRIGEGDLREGVRRVEARTLSLAGRLRSGLKACGFELLGNAKPDETSGIVSLVSDKAMGLFARLKKNNILTSLRSHPSEEGRSIVRFGVHFFNTEKEIDTAISVLQ
jgi:selenocysteine lyase/cysteine desulfurase